MTAARSLRFLRRVARDERGASLIEFGFLIPILALMIGGIIDVSQLLSDRFALHNAVNRSLEMIQSRPMEADADENQVDYSFLKTEAATAANVPVSKVTLTQWVECDGVKQASFSSVCANGTDSARYIKLSVDKTFTGKMFLKTMNLNAAGAVRVQ